MTFNRLFGHVSKIEKKKKFPNEVWAKEMREEWEKWQYYPVSGGNRVSKSRMSAGTEKLSIVKIENSFCLWQLGILDVRAVKLYFDKIFIFQVVKNNIKTIFLILDQENGFLHGCHHNTPWWGSVTELCFPKFMLKP